MEITDTFFSPQRVQSAVKMSGLSAMTSAEELQQKLLQTELETPSAEPNQLRREPMKSIYSDCSGFRRACKQTWAFLTHVDVRYPILHENH